MVGGRLVGGRWDGGRRVYFKESYSIPNNVWKFFENQMEQSAGMFHNNYQKQDSQKMLRNIDMDLHAR